MRLILIMGIFLFVMPSVTEAGKIPNPTPPQRPKRPLPPQTCPAKGTYPTPTNGSDMPGKGPL